MSRSLEDLQPTVRKKAEQLLELAQKENIELLITSTRRTEAEQNSLYAQGRTTPGAIVTNARYPYSLHNHGVAFDIVPVENGQAIWNNNDLWNRVGALGKSIGLEWGGDWTLFPDKPHFQYTAGLTLQDLIDGHMIPNEEPIVSDWARESWNKAEKAGIIGDNTDPQDTVSKEELMVLMDRAKLLEGTSSSTSSTVYTDVSDWAQSSWAKGIQANIISENSHPQDEVTKEELMVFLDRANLIHTQ